MSDLKMSLAVEAEAKLRPLAKSVATLEKQLAHLRHRLETERGNVEKREADLESLKAAASAYLAEDTFPTFKVRLKKITETLAAARESVALFETDLIPRTEKGLQAARENLAQIFMSTVASARSDCESRMSELLAAVVAEHDAFLDAIRELGATFGTTYQGKPPVGYSSRLGDVKHTMSGKWWLTFKTAPPTPAPAAAVAPAAPAAASPAAAGIDVPEAISSPPTPEVEESATGDGPRAVALAPDNEQDGPAPLSVAAPAPVEPPPVADLDPLPATVDAEIDAVLDAEAAAAADEVDAEK